MHRRPLDCPHRHRWLDNRPRRHVSQSTAAARALFFSLVRCHACELAKRPNNVAARVLATGVQARSHRSLRRRPPLASPTTSPPPLPFHPLFLCLNLSLLIDLSPSVFIQCLADRGEVFGGNVGYHSWERGEDGRGIVVKSLGWRWSHSSVHLFEAARLGYVAGNRRLV